MMKFKIRGNVLLILTLTLITVFSYGQNCSLISGTRDKKNGTETIGGITSSKDFYSLLIHKEINHADKSIVPKYTISLVAASRALFSDSILNTKGTFELFLLDNSNVTVKNVSYMNNPIGQCCSMGFQAEIEEDQIKLLAKSPIVTLKVNEIMLTTLFAPKKQKRQQIICDCLLNKQ
jgi:hypothetical protein